VGVAPEAERGDPRRPTLSQRMVEQQVRVATGRAAAAVQLEPVAAEPATPRPPQARPLTPAWQMPHAIRR
jgi:hypothetical protein